MSTFQTYYTSSRMGRSGRAGFGFHSTSDGVAPADLEQIAPLGEITLPRDLDPGLPQDALAAAAPVLLRFRVLPTGRWALIRSRYVGTDYTGRSGNYFAHGLLLDPDEWAGLDGLWPVDLAAWPGWQDRLALDDGVPAPDLRTVNLAEFSPAKDLTPTALAEFLAGIDDAAAHLAAMLRAAFARQATSRAILIRERAERAPSWVACIQKAFPRQLAGALSFCTYQYDSHEAEAINVCVGETNFRFDDADFNYRYFAFDHLGGRQSEVPAEGAEYAARVAGWMVNEPAQLVAFHDFMDLFDLPALDGELTQGLRLFLLEQGTLALPGGAPLLDLLTFAQQRTRPAGRERVLRLLADRLAAVAPELDAGAHGTVVAFLAEGARATTLPAHQERALAAWLGMFDTLVIGRASAFSETAAARADLLQRLPRAAPELARRFLAPERLDAHYPRLVQAPPAVAVAFVREVLGQLPRLDPAGAWPDHPSAGPLAGLTSAAADPAPLLDLLLGAVAGQPAALTEACRVLAHEFAAEAASSARLEALGRGLGRLPPAAVRAIRRALDQPAAHPLLAGEWLERWAGASDPRALLRTYEAQDLPLTPAFAKTTWGVLRSHWWLALPPAEALTVAQDWLLTGRLADLEGEALPCAATLLNDTLPLKRLNRVQQQTARALEQLVLDRGLQLAPNRPLILAARAALKAAGKPDRVALMAKLAGQLWGLPERVYRDLLKDWLAPALADCTSVTDHGAVLRGLYSADHEPAFLRVYGAVLAKLPGDGLNHACRWWLTGGDAVPRAQLEPVLAGRLRKLKPNARGALAQAIAKDRGLKKAARTAWQELLASAERPPGVLARLVQWAGQWFEREDGTRGKDRH